MVKRGEITDEAWERIAPLLPKGSRRGGRCKDHRRVINGILWKLRTGAPWRDPPERYGPWQTCYDRFVHWRRDGIWERLLSHAQTKGDAVGEVKWEVSLDSTVVRAHQHARLDHPFPARQDSGAPEHRARVDRHGLLDNRSNSTPPLPGIRGLHIRPPTRPVRWTPSAP